MNQQISTAKNNASILQWRCNRYAVALQLLCSGTATAMQWHCSRYAVALQPLAVELEAGN